MKNPGLFTLEVDTYEKAIQLLNSMQKNIDEFGYCRLKATDTVGWVNIIDPVIRKRGSKWVLLIDKPIDLSDRL